jgi:hypothetical protein
MAGADFNAVSVGTEGRASGITTGLYWQSKGDEVPWGGVEQAAVGNQLMLLAHDRAT